MKNNIRLVLASVFGGIVALGAFHLLSNTENLSDKVTFSAPSITHNSNYVPTSNFMAEHTNFTEAADKTLHAVVHVKNMAIASSDPILDFFYGTKASSSKTIVGAGSGVIISPDGYIITNNHVIRGAREIAITLNNKKTYKAEVVGSHENTDIALLKINASDLPYITFGNSDTIKVGEWVLAVGKPFNLTSTVTAGIVSAKGRDLDGNNKIDSFIQTDAAVNPGNSGGALVNTRGELVGINTAISSRTGSFIGYSFAIPSNIAKKVVDDIMEFGTVQKAVLGVIGGELNNESAEELKIDSTQGYYISDVSENSGAEKAGLQSGDIIIKLDNVAIATFADLSGFLKTKRPNQIVKVSYLRDGDKEVVDVRLSKREVVNNRALGLELKNLSSKELQSLNLKNGVKIIDVHNKLLQRYGVKRGHIITTINSKNVFSVDEVNDIINNRSRNEAMRIEMLNAAGEKERYIFN